MNIKKHIPNTLTCMNLLSGCYGIILAFDGLLLQASYLIFLACLFDFLDGFVARLLNVSSPIGKELDSLADMVTFGVLPGIILFKLSLINNAFGTSGMNIFSFSAPSWISYICLTIPLCSALRLAKFNIDTRQTEGFIGVPTPATAILVASLPFIYIQFLKEPDYLDLFKMLPVVIGVVMSLLMVSEIPLIALKFKTFLWSENKSKYIFLFISVILFALFQFLAIPLIIILYILASLFEMAGNKKIDEYKL